MAVLTKEEAHRWRFPQWLSQPMMWPSNDDLAAKRVHKPPAGLTEQAIAWLRRCLRPEYVPDLVREQMIALRDWGLMGESRKLPRRRADVFLLRYERFGRCLHIVESADRVIVGFRLDHDLPSDSSDEVCRRVLMRVVHYTIQSAIIPKSEDLVVFHRMSEDRGRVVFLCCLPPGTEVVPEKKPGQGPIFSPPTDALVGMVQVYGRGQFVRIDVHKPDVGPRSPPPYQPRFTRSPVAGAAKSPSHRRETVRVMGELLSKDTNPVRVVGEAIEVLCREEFPGALKRQLRTILISRLKSIDAAEARAISRKIIASSAWPESFDEILEAALKRMSEHACGSFCLGELERLASQPDRRPGQAMMLMRGLPESEDPRHVRVLRKVLRKTRNAKLRRACLGCLAEWTSDPAEVRDDVLRILLEHLHDSDAIVRLRVVRALGLSRDIRYAVHLAPLLRDDDPQLREAAASALCELLGWEKPELRSPREKLQWLSRLRTRLDPVLAALAKLDAAINPEQGND